MRFLQDLFSMWSKLFRKQTKLQFEIDWTLIEWFDDNGEPISCIKLLTGQFKDLVYYYTFVKIVEHPDGDSATIKFGYKLLSEEQFINETAELHKLMFTILQDLIEDKHQIAEAVLPAQHYDLGES